jgi:hypothetical protein
MVVYAYQTTAEGENLSESDEYGVVDLAHRLCQEPACEQCAPEGAHCYRYYELSFSHVVGRLGVTLRVRPIRGAR